MPTGYTADVASGEVADLRTFALRCARAFGATIMQRDNPTDELPKHREPHLDYHREAIAKAEATLTALSEMDEEAVRAAMDAERRTVEESNARYKAENEEKRSRYDAMLREVRAWEPPSGEHDGLKGFMVEQLTSSIDFDCGDYSQPVRELTPSAWKLAKREKAVKDVRYHTEEIEKEIARCNEANAWIDTLYASLPEPPSTERQVGEE